MDVASHVSLRHFGRGAATVKDTISGYYENAPSVRIKSKNVLRYQEEAENIWEDQEYQTERTTTMVLGELEKNYGIINDNEKSNCNSSSQ